METYAFAKEVPSTPIFLPNGKKLTFDTVDGQTGYTITADPGLAGQLFQMIQNGIGGVRQASLEEYEDFVKKKTRERDAAEKAVAGGNNTQGSPRRVRKRGKCCGG